jgi:hypothetical protein
MAELVDITTLGIKVETNADKASQDLDKLATSSKKAEEAANNFVAGVERQAAILGKSRSQVLAYDASKMGLTKTQMAQVRATMDAIDAYEKHERMMSRVRSMAITVGAALGVTLIGALTGVVVALKKSVEAGAEAEQEQLRLQAALKATAHAAGVTREEINALARDMADKTFFDDESIVRAASEMLIFKNVQGETFKEGIRLAGDMAALYGGEVIDHVKALGKALDDPAQGLMMLERSFGKMSERQKDHIKELVETNRLQEAQAAVMDFVRGKVGGVAEAMNTGITAATKNLRKEWGDMMEDIGQSPAVVEAVTAALKLFRDAIKDVRDALAGEKSELAAFAERMESFMGFTGMATKALREWIIEKNKAAKLAGGTFTDGDFDPNASVPGAGAGAKPSPNDDASYNAKKKIGELMKQNATDAAKEAAAVAELSKWWAQLSGTDLAEAIKKYGSLDGAKKQLLAGMPTATKANEAYKQSLESANKVVEEAYGRSGEYKKRVDDLGVALKAGKISAEEYAIAWMYLTYTQTEAGKAALKLQEDTKRLNEDAIKKLQEDTIATTAELEAQAEAMEFQVQTMYMTEAAVIGLALAKKQAALAEMEASGAAAFYTNHLKLQIAALERAQFAASKKQQIEIFNKSQLTSVEKMSRMLDDMAKSANRIGNILSESFGKVGKSIGMAVEALSDFAQRQEEINDRNTKEAMRAWDAGDIEAYHAAIKKANKESEQSTVRMYGDMAKAAKGFFKEGSTGYKTMEAIERGFRMVEMALSFQSYSTQLMQILGIQAAQEAANDSMLSSLVNYVMQAIGLRAAEGQANATAGVANQANGDPYSAFVRMAVMAAMMAALGFAVGGIGGGGAGGGGGMDIAAYRDKQVTGTVLGADGEKSESISNALEILRDNSDAEILYQSAMLSSLRSIDSQMGRFAANIARSQALRGLGQMNRQDQPGGFFSGGNTFTLDDAGIALGRRTADATNAPWVGQTFGQARDPNQLQATGFQWITRHHTGSWGRGGYSATDQDLKPLDTGIREDIARSIGMIGETVLDAFEILMGSSFNEELMRTILDGIEIPHGEISFADLSGDEIQDAINSMLSFVGDHLVTGLLDMLDDENIGALEEFAQVGEGAFETLVRVAAGVEKAEAVLKRYGIEMIRWQDIADKQGDVTTELVRDSIVAHETSDGVRSSIADIIAAFDGSAEEMVAMYDRLMETRDAMLAVNISADLLTPALVQAAGGFSILQEGLSVYFDKFFTEEEQMEAKMEAARRAFKGLGLEMPTTREAMRALIEHYQALGDDEMVGRLLAILPLWDDAATAAEDAAERAKESWKSVQDKIDEILGRDSRGRMQSELDGLVGDYNSQFGGGTDVMALVRMWGDMTSDQWEGLTDSQRTLIEAILDLVGGIKDLDSKTSSTSVDWGPAYQGDPQQMADEYLASFERRFGGVIGAQPNMAGRMSLRSSLIGDQIGANDQRIAELEAQYANYMKPKEYHALIEANRRFREQMQLLGVDMARLAVLTAEYDEKTAEALLELEKWYEEQKRLIGNNQDALIALEEAFGDKRSEIIAGHIEEAERAREQLKDWLRGLVTGSSSPFAPMERMRMLQEQYEEALASGDMEDFQRISQEMIGLGEQLWSRSGPEFLEMFQKIIDDAQELGDFELDELKTATGDDIANLRDTLADRLEAVQQSNEDLRAELERQRREAEEQAAAFIAALRSTGEQIARDVGNAIAAN